MLFFSIADVAAVLEKLHACPGGLNLLMQMEDALFSSKILSVDQPEEMRLLKLEDTLLQLGSITSDKKGDLCQGVIYCLAVQLEDGNVMIR